MELRATSAHLALAEEFGIARGSRTTQSVVQVELEHDGVVHREMYPQVPPKVEYSLTARGRRLDSLLQEMHRWGNELPGLPAKYEPALAPSGRMRPAGSRRLVGARGVIRR